MSRFNWKNVRGSSLRHSMELCIEYARKKKNLSMDRIADLMGVANRWTLYKWLENGRMPAILIPAFEHACGAYYVSTYLATTSHKLVIEMPIGKKPKDDDILMLNQHFNDAVSLLSKFYQGKADLEETVNALTCSISEMAYHRENVKKESTTEFDFGETK